MSRSVGKMCFDLTSSVNFSAISNSNVSKLITPIYNMESKSHF